MHATPGIPVVDIATFGGGQPEAKRGVATVVNDACEETGFVVIVGHGVDQDLIDAVYDVTKQFFRLPLDDKLASAPPAPDVFRGYRPSQSATLAKSLDIDTPPDLVESFVINQVNGDVTPDGAAEAFARFYHPNIWPARPTALPALWSAYYRVMEQLAATLMRIFAMGLGLDEDWFMAKIDRHRANLLANYYPPQPQQPAPGQLRRGAHTDYGSLTILYQDDAPGGLQVLLRQGGWFDVPYIPGSFVINIGDLMAQWTNDRWVSTMHRVVNPPRDAATSERLSIPFFHIPNLDAVIEPLPSCVDEARPARYTPVTAGEWFLSKHLKTVGAGS